MIKRVNSTGRRRIPRDRAELTVFDGKVKSFDGQLNLGGLDLLDRAKVVLEATCSGSNTVRRFECGEVGAVQLPAEKELAGLDGQNVYFTLKVVDRTKKIGRLIGIAERIRPTYDSRPLPGKRGILPIQEAMLGSQIWKLDFQDVDVVLLVNKEITGLVDRFRTDASIYTLIFPEIIRRVLERAIYIEAAELEDESDRWPTTWLRFGRDVSGEDPPVSSDHEAVADWIEEVAERFCEVHPLRADFQRTNGDRGELAE